MNEPDAPPADAAPTFDVLPLGAEVRRAIDAMGYRHPTPVQRAVFEPAAEGRNLVVQARTGTGKTTAFGLPIVDRIVRPSVKAVQALVLCPTRELALQVARELEQLGQFRGIKVVAIYGGASMSKQIEAIEGGGNVVVGTPGRVLDHLRQKTLDPSGIRVLVLDEADEMLSMGFARELNAILELLPKARQGLFFSATLPADIERLAHNQLREPELITLSSDQVGALEIAHFVYVMREGDKIGQLVRILEVEDPESAIIFCNTRDETLRVAEALKARGFDADWLNGDLPQSDRERVMSATREGKLRFLVATDVAARGIDVSHLSHVVNHDFPETAEQYVHRTGRTGRAGRTGTAISIVGPKDIGNLYLLRLTYKIRPIEKQLPSAGELKTRAEMDLVQLFLDAFANRLVHPDDIALARRLLTHEDGERVVAGLLRDHLGARGGDAPTEAAEARRARNPPPRPADDVTPREATPRTTAGRGRTAPAARTESTARTADKPGGLEPVHVERGTPPAPGNDFVPASAAAPEALGMTTAPAPAGMVTSSAAGGGRPPRRRDAEPRVREPRRGAGGRGTPGITNFRWEPPREPDDDEPILETGEAPIAPGSATTPGASPASAPDIVPASRADGLQGLANADASRPGEPMGDPFVQLFVNVGTREGVRPGDLQRLLTDQGIDASAVGGVRVRDRMSFVRVRREIFERARAALSGQVIGGRTVVAELARGRS